MNSSFIHKSVLLKESIEALAVEPDGVYVDGTAGGGGHSAEIARKLGPGGRLVAIDTDPEAVRAACERLAPFGDKAVVIEENFRNMGRVLERLGIHGVDGILLDLGVSSHQFDTPERGFSYHYDAPLDMRMSKSGPTAADLINSAEFPELARILREYGEEKFASRIASLIVKKRAEKPVKTTLELVELIRQAVPAAARRNGNPARKTFQALRIAVNGELDSLSLLLDDALGLLHPGGRLAAITFHSLEDRMVKQRFLSWAQGCICPPDFPVCVCGHKPQVRVLYKRGIVPSDQEVEENPRSRSARLRAAEKL